ncbi:MAG: 4Fe-4S dicluster domain-containing protein [Candidatus Aminicenantes bacterium]
MNKILPSREGLRKAVIDFLKQSLEKNIFDFLLIPVKGPDKVSYSWVLLKDEDLLKSADPLPPVMTVQGGTALSSITKHGKTGFEIAAVMRPCEIRAAVELFKLKQIDLEDITLISIDCPGAIPLADYMNEPGEKAESFQNILEKWEVNDSLRPVCRVCHRFSLPPLPPTAPREFLPGNDEAGAASSDLHIGIGKDGKNIFLIPVTSKGRDILDNLDYSSGDSLKEWESKIEEITKLKLKNKKQFNREWKEKIQGPDKFTDAFDKCINCHNCMRVCPICYCQQCYYDSRNLNLSPDEYLQRSEKKGALRFPLDTLFFHLGRMSHMMLSCVSCGACEDACPLSVPIAQIFTAVGEQVQEDFNYIPGRSRRESLPLQDFREDEFCEVETPCENEEMRVRESEKNV